MNITTQPVSGSLSTPARDWVKVLAKYRQPDQMRSIFEIAISVGMFVIFWVAAWLALDISYWLTLALSLPAALFLVRLFLIQHDCGHHAFFNSRKINNMVGRIMGVLTLTPYEVWRRDHAVHHATSGDLENRGTGDIDTLTVREYQALSAARKLQYRLYRHPFVMFVIGPAYQFILRNRLPSGISRCDPGFLKSTMGTNLAIIIVVTLMIWLIGPRQFLVVQLPVTMIASSIGVWLFYVQHQFEDTMWARGDDWQVHDAALYGSSFYDLPRWLAWLTGFIGIHHVHHLYSRIPFYRLPQVLRDFPELTRVRRITLLDSIACARLRLWDETQQKLVPFSN